MKQDTMSRAIELFDCGDYRQSFFIFVQLYNQAEEEPLRREIMEILTEAYYFPNEEEMRLQYERNRELLQAYPYYFKEREVPWEELPVQLFPIEDGFFYIYDKKQEKFLREYQIQEKREKHFFKDLNQPVKVQDELSFYHLTYLSDNLRRSEDYAGDNHIYACYSSFEVFALLLMAVDIQPLLLQEKFVFLVGEEQWEKYPIDFQKEYGIDYSAMTPAPVRVEEVKRICYWYKHAYSGTLLSLGVLETSSYTQMLFAEDFHLYSKVKGTQIILNDIGKILENPMEQVSLVELKDFLHQPDTKIALPEIEECLAWIEETGEKDSYAVREYFILYFLYQYQKKNQRPRVAPLLVFDPHIWYCSIYNQLIQSFPYYFVLTSVRNPIMTFGRSYLIGLVGWDKFQTQYLLGSDFVHTQFLEDAMLERYYGFRFEDLKEFPRETIQEICSVCDIPFEEKMLSTDTSYTDSQGNTTKGFDTAPLHRDVSRVLSEFDKLRLQMYYAPILDYYGYPSFSFAEYPLSEVEVRDLLAYPFRFEQITKELYPKGPSQEELHQWIQEVLQESLKNKPIMPKLIKFKK